MALLTPPPGYPAFLSACSSWCVYMLIYMCVCVCACVPRLFSRQQLTETTQPPEMYTVNEYNMALKLQHIEYLASRTQPIACEALRREVAQGAAMAGILLSAKYRKLFQMENELLSQQNRVAKYKAQKKEAMRKEKYLAIKAQELFSQQIIKRANSVQKQVREDNVLSQQKMIEFEEKRVAVLWKVLLDCEKTFFSPLECRELSRLYLHLKRATTT